MCKNLYLEAQSLPGFFIEVSSTFYQTGQTESICRQQNKCDETIENGKVLDWSELKGLADYKTKLNHRMKFDLERAENIVGKGENTGDQHFLFVPQCFQRVSFSGSLKVRIM